MTMRSRLGGLATWLGLVAALFALAAYELDGEISLAGTLYLPAAGRPGLQE